MDQPTPPETVTARFSLSLGDRTVACEVVVPTRELTLRELLPALFTFNGQLQNVLVQKEEEAGRKISCRAGCGACCRQLVPVSPVEAELLRTWLAAQAPEYRAAVTARLAEAQAALDRAGLRERLARRATLTAADEVRQLGLDYFAARVPCPFLVDESCSVHPVRPMKCREYLVTSPAAHCADPGPDRIAMVPFPRSFLAVLLRLEQELEGGRPAWLPLASLLEPEPVAAAGARATAAGAADGQAESAETRPERRWPAPQLFQRFVQLLGAGG